MNYPYPFYSPPPDHELIERAMKLAIKLKERDANKKMKMKEAEEKKAIAAKQRMMTSLEWFIIGILMQPVVGPLYHLMLLKLNGMAH